MIFFFFCLSDVSSFSAGDIFASYLIFAAWPHKQTVCLLEKEADAPFLPLHGPPQSPDTGPCQTPD